VSNVGKSLCVKIIFLALDSAYVFWGISVKATLPRELLKGTHCVRQFTRIRRDVGKAGPAKLDPIPVKVKAQRGGLERKKSFILLTLNFIHIYIYIYIYILY
jgi:hypothetical protein